MAKLVLLEDDGATLDVMLDKERITMGRRADNDVCLADPAVSGEHAQVVTLLSDSFLEDLGSTNGTVVNGETVQKHFLRDGDVIDLGRMRLVYFVDDDAQPGAAVRDEAKRRVRADSGTFDTELSQPTQWSAPLGDAAGSRSVPPLTEPRNSSARPAPSAGLRPADATQVSLSSSMSPLSHASHASYASHSGHASHAGTVSRPGAPSLSSGARAASAHQDEEPPQLMVLTGPSAGRVLPLVKDVTTVGRAGVQVALVRRTPRGFLLTAGEGSQVPLVNGLAVASDGSVLVPGDVLEVAGARIEFSAPPDLPT
ncbi:MAG: FHA domain-containing protein [Casimicrobiaceae bacterium]